MSLLADKPVEELIGIRGELDELIASNSPDLKAKIKVLQATLKTIEGK